MSKWGRERAKINIFSLSVSLKSIRLFLALEITMQQHGVHRVVLHNLSSLFYWCLLADHCMYALRCTWPILSRSLTDFIGASYLVPLIICLFSKHCTHVYLTNSFSMSLAAL